MLLASDMDNAQQFSLLRLIHLALFLVPPLRLIGIFSVFKNPLATLALQNILCFLVYYIHGWDMSQSPSFLEERQSFRFLVL